jgi:PhzF family phenazine biosynthesis protein
MKQRRFLELDVFADAPGRGNPLAVVADAGDLDTSTMQAIAAWLNLSETTFVLPASQPGADYRLRIFTPRQELPFAGHPSVGTALVVRAFVPADGIIECAVDEQGEAWIGGQTQTVVNGVMNW